MLTFAHAGNKDNKTLSARLQYPVLAGSPSEKIGIDRGEWRLVIAACEIIAPYVQNEI